MVCWVPGAPWAYAKIFHHLDLPATKVTETMYFDEESRRTVPRKTHLDDDAYNNVTSLECLVDTLMNVQVNAHHPDGDVPNACYPLKYALKPEKTLQLSLAHETDDQVLQHMRGQFISLGEVVESLLGDKVVDATFSQEICPLLFPAWKIPPKMVKVQSMWRDYAFRFPFEHREESRFGYECRVPGLALQVSTVMAPASRFLRYFHAEIERKDQKYELHPKSMTRHVWKDATEDVHQQWYDPILAEILPSYRLANTYIVKDQLKTVNRKLAKDSLRYPRYMFYEPVLISGKDEISKRANHFKIRLFEFLPWLASQQAGNDVGQYICTPVPRRNYKLKSHLGEYVQLQRLSENLSSYEGIHDSLASLPCLRLRDSFWESAGDPPYEQLCIFLERSFCENGMVCECCDLQLEKRCPYCMHAVGWHRCCERMKSEKLSFADLSGFVWKRNTLYHVHHDTEVTILNMLRQGKTSASIYAVLEQLRKDGAVAEDKCQDIEKLIQSMSGGLLDNDPINFQANAEFMAGGHAHAFSRITKEEAEQKLEMYEEKFQALWDEKSSTYLKYSEHSPPKPVPTQYLALQQLRQRCENPGPLLVAVPAPAGYGKTQLIFAWLAYLRTVLINGIQPNWAVMAITGVAASNTGGSTAHAFFQLRKEGNSGLYNDREAKKVFQTVPCLLKKILKYIIFITL